jgi:hypothetical protein
VVELQRRHRRRGEGGGKKRIRGQRSWGTARPARRLVMSRLGSVMVLPSLTIAVLLEASDSGLHTCDQLAPLRIRLSALVVLYFHPLKGIFLPGHPDSFLYTQLSRIRSYSISMLYTNYHPKDPLARIF